MNQQIKNIDRLTECPICGSGNTWKFFEQNNVACQDGVLWNTKEEAKKAARGKITLVFCRQCLFIGNISYDPSLVQFDEYDISLHNSPSFNRYSVSLAERLVSQYSIKGKTVLEIGCGTGDFLRTVCSTGGNTGIGFDPSFTDEKSYPGVTFIPDFYSKDYGATEAHLIVCRQVLDIQRDPRSFLTMVHDNIKQKENTVVYFEVFNAENTLRDLIVWNVIYEHRSWFVPESLAALFTICGFRIINVGPCWNGEYIGIEAVPLEIPDTMEVNGEARERLETIIQKFVQKYDSVIDLWKRNLLDVAQYKVAAWGAGARGITFLNANDSNGEIPIVDINPKRQGKYLPITAQKVESPDYLLRHHPDIVIITNPTYSDEIKSQAQQMGLTSQFMIL